MAKTTKLDKVAQKLVMSNNKATGVLKQIVLNTKQATQQAKDLDVKSISKQASRGVRNITNKTLENTSNSAIRNKVNEAEDKTDK